MSRTFTALALLTVLGFGGAGMAWANGDLEFGYTPSPQVGEKPALYVTPARAVDELLVTCTVGPQRETPNRFLGEKTIGKLKCGID